MLQLHASYVLLDIYVMEKILQSESEVLIQQHQLIKMLTEEKYVLEGTTVHSEVLLLVLVQ